MEEPEKKNQINNEKTVKGGKRTKVKRNRKARAKFNSRIIYPTENRREYRR